MPGDAVDGPCGAQASSSPRIERSRLGAAARRPTGQRSRRAVERLELLGEVALQAGAVLALERAEVLHLAAELVALLLEVAEHLLATLGGLGVEHLRRGCGRRPRGGRPSSWTRPRGARPWCGPRRRSCRRRSWPRRRARRRCASRSRAGGPRRWRPAARSRRGSSRPARRRGHGRPGRESARGPAPGPRPARAPSRGRRGAGAEPPWAAESFDRRSSFSFVSRASSASTSSRNWSTSPMS